MFSSVLVALSLLLQEPAAGAPVAAPPSAAPLAAPAAPAAGKTVILPAGSALQVEMVDTLSSATSKLGERFAIRLAEPIVSEGVTVIAAGALGEGEIIDVAKAGYAGKQGKLIVSARFLTLNGQPARVRGMTWMKSGESQVNAAIVVGLIVPVASFFIEGGDIQIPRGARASVKLAQDTPLSVDPPVAATAAPTGVSQ